MADYEEPSSPVYNGKLFHKYDFEWNTIYLLPRLVTVDTLMGTLNTKCSLRPSFDIQLYFFCIRSLYLYALFVTKKMKLFHVFFSQLL